LDYLINQVGRSVILARLDGSGEPLLHPCLLECIRRLRRAGIGVDLSSHFNILPPEGVEGLVESGLDRIIVAVDGATQEVYQRYRTGGVLSTVLDNIQDLVDARARLGRCNPLIEMQFLDWGYNAHQIPTVREMAKTLRVDRLTIISPDKQVEAVKLLPRRPKRCFWLWCVLTIDWELNYHSCTNAWTYMFPETNARDVRPVDIWNSRPFVEARVYNRTKQSALIAAHCGCMCNRCTDMLVVKRPPGYVCE
jgi:MoaA/NifB/PqqE/SkfB family radical SAM enzyme